MSEHFRDILCRFKEIGPKSKKICKQNPETFTEGELLAFRYQSRTVGHIDSQSTIFAMVSVQTHYQLIT